MRIKEGLYFLHYEDDRNRFIHITKITDDEYSVEFPEQTTMYNENSLKQYLNPGDFVEITYLGEL